MVRHAALSVLVACSSGPVSTVPDFEATGLSVAPEDRRPPPGDLRLVVEGSEAGGEMHFGVAGLFPGERIGLGTSPSEGEGPCFVAIGGSCLGLEAPLTHLFVAVADAGGEVHRSMPVPRAIEGSTRCFQAAAGRGVDGVDSATSNVVCVDITPAPVVCDAPLVADCAGVCGGTASLDSCGRCVGGTTGLEPVTADVDDDDLPDLCETCGPYAGARLVVQWTEVETFVGRGPFTFQVVLHENGDFAYYYTSLLDFDASATIGWQSDLGATFVELGHHTEFPLDYPNVYFDTTVGDLPVADYLHPMEYDDIRWTGVPLGLSDDGRAVVDIGFDFPFLDIDYSEVVVLANGVVSFGAGPYPSYSDSPLPRTLLGPFLAILWDDLDPEHSGEVYVQAVPRGCAADCAGTYGGVAVEDTCEVCAGGAAGIGLDLQLDCAGVCDGLAWTDECGFCVGGTTGIEPTPRDACPFGPDLIVDQDSLRENVHVDYVDVEDDSCLVLERCVHDVGLRRVLRFDTMIANVGTEDLYLGDPETSEDFTWDECHDHHHFEEYAWYDLRDLETDEVLPGGTKAGFCVMDLGVYDEEIAGDGCEWYHCGDQGVSAGCFDVYHNSLQCQWIDITEVPDGDYELIVTTNPEGRISETDLDNNSATVSVRLAGDEVSVLD